MVGEEDLVEFLKEKGEATLDEIPLALKIPKHGPCSAYSILYSLKSKNIVERRGSRWVLIQGEKLQEIYKFPSASASTDGESLERPVKIVEEKSEFKPLIDGQNKNFEAGGYSAHEENVKASILRTGTILDNLFFGFDGEPLEGVPASGQFIIAGPLGAGKSLLAGEIAIKVAYPGRKVLFMPLDDIWENEIKIKVFDLQSRMAIKAKALEIDWNSVSKNLYVVRTQQPSGNILEGYEDSINRGEIELAIIDPINQLEHLIEPSRIDETAARIININRSYGVTGIFVAHTALKDKGLIWSLAGEKINYLVDGVIEVLPARASISSLNGDATIDTGRLRAVGVIRCRLCRFIERYMLASISPGGLIKNARFLRVEA